MFILGHLVIGSRFANPFTFKKTTNPIFEPNQKRLRNALLIGLLLPDLIDKPLYYGFLKDHSIGMVVSTRTFGHTLLLCLTVALSAKIFRSRVLTFLAWGCGIHLFLDHGWDFLGTVFDSLGFFGDTPHWEDFAFFSDRWAGLLWPLLGFRFPHPAFDNIYEHFLSFLTSSNGIGELLALGVGVQDYYQFKELWKK